MKTLKSLFAPRATKVLTYEQRWPISSRIDKALTALCLRFGEKVDEEYTYLKVGTLRIHVTDTSYIYIGKYRWDSGLIFYKG